MNDIAGRGAGRAALRERVGLARHPPHGVVADVDLPAVDVERLRGLAPQPFVTCEVVAVGVTPFSVKLRLDDTDSAPSL